MYFMCLCISYIFYFLPSSWRLCKTRWRRATRLWGDLRTSWSRGSASCRPWRWSWRVCTNRWAASPEGQNHHVNTLREGFYSAHIIIRSVSLPSHKANTDRTDLLSELRITLQVVFIHLELCKQNLMHKELCKHCRNDFKIWLRVLPFDKAKMRYALVPEKGRLYEEICQITTQKILTEVRIQSQVDQLYNLRM